MKGLRKKVVEKHWSDILGFCPMLLPVLIMRLRDFALLFSLTLSTSVVGILWESVEFVFYWLAQGSGTLLAKRAMRVSYFSEMYIHKSNTIGYWCIMESKIVRFDTALANALSSSVTPEEDSRGNFGKLS